MHNNLNAILFFKVIENKIKDNNNLKLKFNFSNFQRDQKLFLNHYTRDPKEIHSKFLKEVYNYMNTEKTHKSHRIQKFKTFSKTYLFTKHINSQLFIENIDFLKENPIHNNLFYNSKNEHLDPFLNLSDKFNEDNAIFNFFMNELFSSLLYNIINSKNSYVLPDLFVLNRYSILSNSKNYFDLLIYSFISVSTEFNEKEAVAIFDEFKICLEEILIDVIILFENLLTFEKQISFKELTSLDMWFLIDTSNWFLNLESEVKPFYDSNKIKHNKYKTTVIGDLNQELKHLKEISKDIKLDFIEDILASLKIVKLLTCFQKKEIESVIIKQINLFLNDAKMNNFNSWGDSYGFIKKIVFLIKQDKTFAALINIIKLYVHVYKNIISKFNLFKSSLHMFVPPYNLKNIEVSVKIMVVYKEYALFLKNHNRWYRTMILSNNPLILIKYSESNWVSTNGVPNNTLNIFSSKNNKIFNILDKNSNPINTLEKLNSTPFKIDHNYLKLIQNMIKSLRNMSPNTIQEQRYFSSLLSAEELIILEKFSFLVEEYKLDKIYLPWYFDSRMRIYCYSSFSPTAGRVIRGVLNINYLTNGIKIENSNTQNATELEFFDSLKDEDFDEFLKKLSQLDENLFGSFPKLSSLPQNERVNIKIYLISIANRYWKFNNNFDNDRNFNDVDTHKILLDNFFLKIKNESFKLIIFLRLFKKNDFIAPLGLYANFFIDLYKNSGNSRSDSFEELLVLYGFSRFFYSEDAYFIQYDVSASVLVLCGLILKFTSPKLLNVSNNNFIKNDPYENLTIAFKKSLGLQLNDSRFNDLLNRSLLKSPAMTIMYGSGEANTIENLVLKLKALTINKTGFKANNSFLLSLLSEKVFNFLTESKPWEKDIDKLEILEKNKSFVNKLLINFYNEPGLNLYSSNEVSFLKKFDKKNEYSTIVNDQHFLLKKSIGHDNYGPDHNIDKDNFTTFINKNNAIKTAELELEQLKIGGFKRSTASNSDLAATDQNKLIFNNALAELFFKDNLNKFKDYAEKNLLIYGGVIWINNEPSILTYTDQTTRVLSTLLKIKNCDQNITENPDFLMANNHKNLAINKATGVNTITDRSPLRFTTKKRNIDLEFHELFVLNSFSFQDVEFKKKIIIKFLMILKKGDSQKKISLNNKSVRGLLNELKIICTRRNIEQTKLIENPYKLWIEYLKKGFQSQDWLKFIELFSELNEQDLDRLCFLILKCLNETQKFSIAFRANVIHSVDAYIARQMIIENPDYIITNHDCFYINSRRLAEAILFYNKIFLNLTIRINLEEFSYKDSIKNNLPFFI